ncbi:hypothetical protein ACBJ59_36285 [Nonomuraea sp. MTCD27]|uniref:hypothetical protein n=1 Tax=Nonomuraea sp. MTCD27 TaxID=1676747 RepID=UPI0035C259D9
MTSTEMAQVAPSLPDKMTYAKALAESGLLPAQYRKQPANVLYALEYGATIGIGTMAAITGVHVIDGKPTASAGLISALVRRAGHRLRQRIERDQQGNPVGVCEITRADDPEYTYRSEWTLQRAVTAGLVEIRSGKPFARDKNGRALPWEKYPEAMLKARATTECARDACEEVLFGLHYTPEELGAEVAEDGTVIITDARPQPAPPPPAPDAPVGKDLLAVLAGQFTALGVTDRAEGLMTIALLTGHKVTSSKELTTSQAQQLIDVLDPLTQAEDPVNALDQALRQAMAATEADSADVIEGQIVSEENHDNAA